jgi:hypothetical protein
MPVRQEPRSLPGRLYVWFVGGDEGDYLSCDTDARFNPFSQMLGPTSLA